MLTKEEIVIKHNLCFYHPQSNSVEDVFAAMEEYAKEVAIGFAIAYNTGVNDRMEVRYEKFMENHQL